jgi:N-acetylglucosamine-6-phosphate deacetylase
MSDKINGYFDLQVNGCYGLDFNQDNIDPDAMHRCCQRLEADGVNGILATLITEQIDTMALRLATIVTLRQRDPLVAKMIAGFHIEGPFISPEPGYKGAHPVDAIHPANVDGMKKLLDAADGLTRLVTLAPEQDHNFTVTDLLARQKITVSAGHTNASLDQLRGAADHGLSMFTHVGNGCPMQMNRHDNIVQRVLNLRDRIWLCFICDGAHIPFYALRNYIDLGGFDRCCAVTDAIAPAGLGPGKYTISRWELVIDEDMVARAPDRSHLVGAAITMPQTVANMVQKVGLTEAQARQLACANPRRAIGLA